MLMALFINERGSVFGGHLLPQKYSPTQRSLDAYGMRFAGARYGHAKISYNLFLRNCTTQASKWLGMPFVNNPGTFANNITGNVPYYNSFSITGPLLW